MTTAAEATEKRRRLPSWVGHPVLIGAAWGMGFVLLVSLLAGPLLSRDRAASVSLQALKSGAIPDPYTHPIEDYFTECSVLSMNIARKPSPVTNAVASYLLGSVTARPPCQGLQALADGTESRTVPSRQPPYANYPFGPRYLQAWFLSVLSYGATSDLYVALSYVSILTLAAAAFVNNRRMALLTAPLYLTLLFAFGLRLFGQNLAHAPGFFAGFLILAFFLAARTRFQRPEARLALLVALGLVMSYFDMLNGPLLTMLALSLVLNQLFYVRETYGEDSNTKTYAQRVGKEALTIVACFAGSYVFLTVLHLALLTLIDGSSVETYRHGLSMRMGGEVGAQHVGLSDVISRLWLFRDDLVLTGGFGAASWFLMLGIAAWLLAFFTSYLDSHAPGPRLLADAGVLVLASLGVLAWYVLFLNHSFVHAPFTVRVLALPAAFGFVALLLVLDAVRVHEVAPAQRWLFSGAVLVAIVIPAWGLHNAWATTRNDWRVEAHRLADGADLVACANGVEGLRPDGKPDATIELTLHGTTPPLSLVHLRPKPKRPNVRILQLTRDEPGGAWATLSGNTAIGVTTAANGKLINAPDSSTFLPNPGHYYLHYCNDGKDNSGSKYRLLVDGITVDLPK